jgi:hypothetical protein
MPRFLIETTHDGTPRACTREIELFHQTGSHFLTHADWGCKDGVHKAWIIVEMDSKDDARNILPPQDRAEAKVIQLNKFSMQELDELLRLHGS